MNEQSYNMYGLIHDLLLVTTHRVEHMPAVVNALEFLKASRNEFESNQAKAEDVSYGVCEPVPSAKKRKSKKPS